MAYKFTYVVMAASLALLPVAAAAHIVQGSLSIKSTDSFAGGSTVNITWGQMFGHNDGKYQLRYSKDGGNTWTDIQAAYQGPKGDGVTVTYSWTIPTEATTQARCM